MENFLGNWWLAKQLGVNGGQKRCSEGKLTSVQQMKKNIVNIKCILKLMSFDLICLHLVVLRGTLGVDSASFMFKSEGLGPNLKMKLK